MSYTFWALHFLFGSLFWFVSGEDVLCVNPDPDFCKYFNTHPELCKHCKLQIVDVFTPREGGPCPSNAIINLSNHALVKLISRSKHESSYNITTQYPTLNQSAEMVITPQLRGEVPFIDLCGIVYLILSNNSVTVDTLVNILYDQRIRNNSEELLKYLDLSYLNISWLPDHIFGQLRFLQVLKLNNNPIGATENIKNAVIQLKLHLQELDLSGCGLKYLPDFFQHFQLSKLDLSNNQFTAVPLLYSISHSLRKLIIDVNPLSILDDRAFSTYYRIEEISAENCSIYTITENTFSNNYNLSKLNLKNNNIRYLFPNDIPLTHDLRPWISLGNNPWDCTCRNLWLMKELSWSFTKIDDEYEMRCSTPQTYANKHLRDMAKIVEALDNCDSLFFNLLHKPPSPFSSNSLLLDSFMGRESMTNILLICGLFATIVAVAAVVLVRKSNNNSRQQIYKPLYIIQEEDSGYLDEERIQHI